MLHSMVLWINAAKRGEMGKPKFMYVALAVVSSPIIGALWLVVHIACKKRK